MEFIFAVLPTALLLVAAVLSISFLFQTIALFCITMQPHGNGRVNNITLPGLLLWYAALALLLRTVVLYFGG